MELVPLVDEDVRMALLALLGDLGSISINTDVGLLDVPPIGHIQQSSNLS